MIATKPSPSYVARAIFMIVLCVGFCIWGAYDLWVAIPRRAHLAQRFTELKQKLDQLDAARQDSAATGQQPTQAQIDEYTRVSGELAEIAPGGKVPAPPSKFDKNVQWIYIACGPFALMPALSLLRLRRQRYRLEENGTLHFEGDRELGSGDWQASDIADIDMHRWMAKSVAWVVHLDGRRLKLDAYLHSDLHLIIGSIAARLHPDAWQPDARPVKADGEAGEESEKNPDERRIPAETDASG